MKLIFLKINKSQMKCYLSSIQFNINACLKDDLLTFLFFFKLFFLLFYKFYFIFKIYKIVLVLPNIKMNPPQVYMCFPS